MDITPEMVDALDTLRKFARTTPPSDIAKAIDVLDNADFFTGIDEALEEEEERYAQTMARLRGISLNDRYPRGDENGIIGRAGEGPGFLSNLPQDTGSRPHWVSGGPGYEGDARGNAY